MATTEQRSAKQGTASKWSWLRCIVLSGILALVFASCQAEVVVGEPPPELSSGISFSGVHGSLLGRLAAADDENQTPDLDEQLDSFIDDLRSVLDAMRAPEFAAEYDNTFDQLVEGWEDSVLAELREWDAQRAQAELADPVWDGVYDFLDQMETAIDDPEFVMEVQKFTAELRPSHVIKLVQIVRLGNQIVHEILAELDERQDATLARLLAETADELDRLRLHDDVEIAIELVDHLTAITESELRELGIYHHVSPVWHAIVDSVSIVTDFLEDGLLS